MPGRELAVVYCTWCASKNGALAPAIVVVGYARDKPEAIVTWVAVSCRSIEVSLVV